MSEKCEGLVLHVLYDSDVDHVVSSNLIGQLGPVRRLSA